MAGTGAQRYQLLLEINQAIVKFTNRKDLFQAIAKETKKIVPYDRLAINLYDSQNQSLSYFGTAVGVSPKGMGGNKRPLEHGAIARETIRTRQPVIIPDLNRRRYWSSVRSLMSAGLTSSMAFPLIAREKILGTIHFSFKQCPADIQKLAVFLGEFADVASVAVDNMLAYTSLKKTNQSLVQQKHFILENSEDSYRTDSFFYTSPAMAEVMQQVELIAASDASVLITGETGTGKDYVARYIHRLSPRRESLFVKVNCPALTESLFESELFGHAKGAFTGAVSERVGRFEVAHGGTVFLDEIGELPPSQQAKLLNVLQDHTFERVGDSKSITADFRAVAATNRDMDQAIGAKEFRSDLFYRLSTFSLHLPPLRERMEDIPLLVHKLSQVQAAKTHLKLPIYTPSAMEVLCKYHWPGNVRELKNLVKRINILRPGESVSAGDVAAYTESGDSTLGAGRLTLHEVERQHLEKVMTMTSGRLGGAQGAAHILGIPRTTLQYRLKKHGLDPKDFSGIRPERD